MKVRYTTMIADNMKDSVDFYENVMGFYIKYYFISLRLAYKFLLS